MEERNVARPMAVAAAAPEPVEMDKEMLERQHPP